MRERVDLSEVSYILVSVGDLEDAFIVAATEAAKARKPAVVSSKRQDFSNEGGYLEL